MDFRFLHLRRPYLFESPFDGEFVLLLEVTDLAVTAEEQQDLSRSFVESGCRYALCRGVECSSWDDSIDWAIIDAEEADDTRPFVRTTWHADELLEETLEFMLTCTAFDDFVPTSFAVVEIGGDGGKLAQARAALGRLQRGSEP